MKLQYTFPFGQQVHTVEQSDRTPKKVFILGVYASAVHAKWTSETGQTLIQAFAVASEPSIFWRGENAGEIVDGITIPIELGHLEPASPDFNGPSGRALDDLFLHPLGVERSDSWLCDLLPHACLNKGQQNAIEKKYKPLMAKHHLPEVTVPPVPKQFADEQRRQEICDEIRRADPSLVLLLGDQPIRWFLSAYGSYHGLSDFGTKSKYGQVHPILVNEKRYNVLPLVHPRQAGGLSSHSIDWRKAHHAWTKRRSRGLGKEYLGT